MAKGLIRWRDRDLLNDVTKTNQYHNSVVNLVNVLLKDENVRCKIEPLANETGEYRFAVYVGLIESEAQISSIQGDVWRPSFRDYIINTYANHCSNNDYSDIVDLLTENRLAIKYIFQELMYRVVNQHDNYKIVGLSGE